MKDEGCAVAMSVTSSAARRSHPLVQESSRRNEGRRAKGEGRLPLHPSSFALRPSLVVPFPSDPRSQCVQTLVDALVAAVDLVDVVNDALAFGAERGQEQGHAGADVGAGDLRAGETIAAHDDGAVRVAEDDTGTHLDQFVGEEQAEVEPLLGGNYP